MLLIAGENDKGHWVKGDAPLENKREMFMGAKYAATTRGAHVVLIPRYGHVGYAELYNEKIAYLWLWAYKSQVTSNRYRCRSQGGLIDVCLQFLWSPIYAR